MSAESQDVPERLQGTAPRRGRGRGRAVPVSTHRPKIRRVVPTMLATQAWVEREKRTDREDDRAGRPEASEQLLEGDAPPPPAPPPPPPGGTALREGLVARLRDMKHSFLVKQRYVEKKSPNARRRFYELLRPPYFIISMIVVFVCMELWAGAGVRAALEYAPGRRREAWRLLSYCALHAGPQHLALNALVALAVGWVLEREQGAARVAALWCGGVVAGALGTSVLQPGVHVIGASAGVYALLTSHLANVFLGYGHIPLWWFRVLAVAVLGASDCAWVLLRSVPRPTAVVHASHAAHAAHAAHEAPVAWAAHALGAAAGLPLALLIFTGENCGRLRVRVVRVARGLSAAALAGAAAAAVLSNVYVHEGIER